MGNPKNSMNYTLRMGERCYIGQLNELKLYNAVEWETLADLPPVVAFDYHTGASSILNLNHYAVNAVSTRFTCGMRAYEVDDYLENIGGYKENDSTWSNFKNDLNEAVQWLWGDLEGGGLGIFTTDVSYTDGVYFIATYGVYENESGHQRICSFVNNIAYSVVQLTECMLAFVYNENNDTGGHYIHCIYYPSGANTAYTFAGSNPRSLTHTAFIAGTSNSISTLTYTGKKEWLLHTYPAVCVERNGTSYIGGNSDVCPETRELSITGYDHTEGDFADENTAEHNEKAGTTTPTDAEGDFSTWSDPIDYTDDDQFTIDAINSGFVTLYNPNQANIQAFTNFLFASITEETSIALKRLISNPLDYVISMNMIHYSPSTSGNENIKFCGIDSGVSAPRITTQFQSIDCGTIYVDEQYNSFLDYGGYTRAKLVVPYCGIFPISINDIMGAYVGIKYRFDLLTGACVAQVKVTRTRDYMNGTDSNLDSVLYEFTGNIFSQVPLSAVDYRGTIQGLMQIASGVSQVAMGSSSGLGNIASGVMSLTPDVQHSGNMATSYGYMGKQVPYIIIECPLQAVPNEMGAREGYVSNIYVSKLGDVTGYNEIDPESFKTEFINCTDAERDEIIKLLSGGFII